MQGQTYLFSHIEAALAHAYGELARGQLNRMTAVRMFPQVGRGGLVKYRWEHIRKIVVAMELAEFGVSIRSSARLITSHWKYLNGFCERAEKASRENRAAILMYLLRHAVTKDDNRLPHVDVVNADHVGTLLARLAEGNELPRLAATNLTARLKSMDEALKQTKPRYRGRPKGRGIEVRYSRVPRLASRGSASKTKARSRRPRLPGRPRKQA
jgi:hypothetical protein